MDATPSRFVLEELLARAATISGDAAAEADALDRTATFPAAAVAALASSGLLAAPLPPALGGAGLSEGPELLRLLHILGRGSMPLGRIFEAHVNALRLVLRYGGPSQLHAAAADAAAGRLFALWVTDAAGAKVRAVRRGDMLELAGAKHFCSAAGHADCALITADDGGAAPVMLLLRLGQGERVAAQGPALQGMRAAITRRVEFDRCQVPVDAIIGSPGDYMREPEFSTGAWRSAAVALGGLAALLAAASNQVVSRGHDAAPHQRARLGRIAIAHHTGWLWLESTARLVQAPETDPADAAAYVNLARTAVETAAMESLHAVHRTLGLGAFVQGNPAERLGRDLATYLRQPAPDEALDEAAAHFIARPLPGEPA